MNKIITIKKENKLCLDCMKTHDVLTVKYTDETIIKDQAVKYEAISFYCENTHDYFTDEVMLSQNDKSAKDAYRKKAGLLTSADIQNIRTKYGISQTDLAVLLGWGEKTISRYESHQIQDFAHDSILQKINDDPEWFLSFLEKSKCHLSDSSYNNYKEKALSLYEEASDIYLRKTINGKYAKFNGNINFCGGTPLNIEKIIDVINYFANSEAMRYLFKVKLMKLLWYADNLSFKRYGHSITGLAYRALPMGAVPIGHDLIVDLKGIEYEELTLQNSYKAIQFTKTDRSNYPNLTQDDIDILDTVISAFASYTKDEIVETMHNERAYSETAPTDIIPYEYSEFLTLE